MFYTDKLRGIQTARRFPKIVISSSVHIETSKSVKNTCITFFKIKNFHIIIKEEIKFSIIASLSKVFLPKLISSSAVFCF